MSVLDEHDMVLEKSDQIKKKSSVHTSIHVWFVLYMDRHAHNPFYSQTFIADIQKNEVKVCVYISTWHFFRDILLVELCKKSLHFK